MDVDAVGVPNVYVPEISFRIDERLPGSSRLNSLGQQFLGKRVDVGDADGKMGDAYLVKKNRAPVGFFSGMAGQREGRDGETLSGTQADASAGLAGVLVVMGAPSFCRVGGPVEGYPLTPTSETVSFAGASSSKTGSAGGGRGLVSKDGAGVAAGSPTVSFVAGTGVGGWLGEVEAALFGVRAGAASGAASVADEVGANGSTATCVGDRTGTAVAGSSMTCSCPHPTNNRMLNDSTNRRHLWIPSFVNIALIIQITSYSPWGLFFLIIGFITLYGFTPYSYVLNNGEQDNHYSYCPIALSKTLVARGLSCCIKLVRLCIAGWANAADLSGHCASDRWQNGRRASDILQHATGHASIGSYNAEMTGLNLDVGV